MENCVIFQVFVIFLQLLTLPNLHAQDDQAGFISLDCGRSNGYTDRDTGLRYNSDNDFIDTGVSRMISNDHQSNLLYQQFLYLRSFPHGTRNCYTLNLPQANDKTFLVRGRFFYGNYDNKRSLPIFDLQIGVDVWGTVKIYNESIPIRKEIIYTPKSNFVQVCLINIKSGIPFISALEIRPMNDTIYRTNYSLDYLERIDLASSSINLYRYKDDIYDRIWLPWSIENSTNLATSLPISPGLYQLPNIVMNTANSPNNPDDFLVYPWNPGNITDQFYMFLHFAELTPNVTREFNIYVNNKFLSGPYSPKYLQSETIVIKVDARLSTYELSLNRTNNSELPPLLNAIEIYTIKQASSSQTNDQDVGGIMGIKSTYKVLKNWQGDPCSPQSFSWDGITCSYEGFNPPQIISLNLSSNGLTGEISPFIQNLTSLQTLDLSNNSLAGNVPIFLSQLSSLQVLNLKGNNLTCPMPSSLGAKIKNLSDDCKGNSTQPPKIQNKHEHQSNTVIVIAASVGGFSILVIVASILFYCIRRKRTQSTGIVQSSTISSPQIHRDFTSSTFEIKNCQFSYSEILKITNNFQRVLGKGGFGTVYHGYVGNTPVAVKMLSRSSTQGYKEFQAQAKFLVSVNHKNLISVVGYCYEDYNMGLLYEFMENGNLLNHISEKSSQILNWEERLRIAVDAAQGLEYLHNGCKPSIIHKDVKATNILLNGEFEAKLADFGLSRTIPLEGDNYVSTVVVGTPGYIDPEYFVTNRLTEKSDVYSFGIVLLEIVTGKSAVSTRQGNAHIISWVDEMISNADATQIADKRLKGNFDTNCFRKLVELAIACVTHESARRPNMTQVVIELKECLAFEIARHDIR